MGTQIKGAQNRCPNKPKIPSACIWATIQNDEINNQISFQTTITANETRAEGDEMENGIISNEVSQFQSTTKSFLSVVVDDHFYHWKDTSKSPACVD